MSLSISRSASSSLLTDESDPAKPPRKKAKWQQNVPADWLQEETQTRKYNLTLNGLGFCRSWDFSDAIRDLIQNATDSMYAVHKKQHSCKKPRLVLESPPDSWDASTKIVTKVFLECEKEGRTDKPAGYLIWTPCGEQNPNGPVISIVNLGGSFTPDALCMGMSEKNEDDAGGHGEGLKAAITVAIRANGLFEIFQSGVAIKFKKSGKTVVYKVSSPKHKSLDCKPFTKELTKKFGVSTQDDVIVHLGDTSALTFADYQNAVKHFLFFTHRHPASRDIGTFPVVTRKETKSGRALLLGEEFAGKVYVRGIHFKTVNGYQRFYGVDLIKNDAPSRDRNEISDERYGVAMAKTISEVLEDDPIFAQTILEEFRRAEASPFIIEHLKLLPRFASSTTKRHLIEAFKSKPENGAIKYIVSGISADHLTNNALVPHWCDVRACKVITPVLFDLISEGFPSMRVIMSETTRKLKSCPFYETGSREVAHWIQDKRDFFDQQQLLNLLIEVRKTENFLDVPFYVVEDGPKIIFSERALRLKTTDPRKFLDIVTTAIQEAAKMRVIAPEAPRVNDVAPEPMQKKAKSDFAVPENVSHDWKVGDGREEIALLQNSLTETISFGDHEIACTPAAKIVWNRLLLEKKGALESLTTRSINACHNALATLKGDANCPLSFYIGESDILGCTKKDGISINLRSVLLEVTNDTQVEESSLKAYAAVLISHEYAHFVKLEDGHSPEHGRRTEWNMQTLLQEAYKSQ